MRTPGRGDTKIRKTHFDRRPSVYECVCVPVGKITKPKKSEQKINDRQVIPDAGPCLSVASTK